MLSLLFLVLLDQMLEIYKLLSNNKTKKIINFIYKYSSIKIISNEIYFNNFYLKFYIEIIFFS